MKNGLRLSHGVGEARAPAARPERSGGGRPLREPLDTELPVSYRTSSSSCHLPGRPLCARTSVQPRLPHLSAVETKQSLRLSHGVGEARASGRMAGAQRRGLSSEGTSGSWTTRLVSGLIFFVPSPRPPPLRPDIRPAASPPPGEGDQDWRHTQSIRPRARAFSTASLRFSAPSLR